MKGAQELLGFSVYKGNRVFRVARHKENMQPRFLYPSPPCGAPLKKFRGALELI